MSKCARCGAPVRRVITFPGSRVKELDCDPSPHGIYRVVPGEETQTIAPHLRAEMAAEGMLYRSHYMACQGRIPASEAA